MGKDRPQPGWYLVEPRFQIGPIKLGSKVAKEPIREGQGVVVEEFSWAGQSESTHFRLDPEGPVIWRYSYDERYGTPYGSNAKPITLDQAKTKSWFGKKVTYQL